MFKNIFIISFILLNSSCCFLNINKNDNLNQADMVRISFYSWEEEDESLNENYKSIELTKKDEINFVLGFISNQDAELAKCLYHGSIDFFKNGKSILENKMEFNLYPGCQYIVFIKNDRLYSKKLTVQGVNFLKEQYEKIPENMRF
jgi:hypothetical protein